jgi:hypothetical protein
MKRRTIVLLALAGIVGISLALTAVRWRLPAAALGKPLLVLYWEESFQGRSLEVTGTLADLPVEIDLFGNEFDWNDQVRSITVVSGTWRLYQHGRCNTELDETLLGDLNVAAKQTRAGWSCLISATSARPLELPSAAAGGFEPDISSIELVSEENLPDWAAPQWRFSR